MVHYFPSTHWLETEQFDLVVSGITLLIFFFPLILGFIRNKK
jgi:hypothetical protein